MRRLPLVIVLFAAALSAAALSLASPAGAHVADPAEGEACPAPQIVHDYDRDGFGVEASLVASGCEQREQRTFQMSVSVTRYDDDGSDTVERIVLCGPFRPSSDTDSRYSCDVEVVRDHPPVEAVRYWVEVTYPGADGEEVSAGEAFCVSDAAGAHCQPQDDNQ